jgi:hypothetical protein
MKTVVYCRIVNTTGNSNLLRTIRAWSYEHFAATFLVFLIDILTSGLALMMEAARTSETSVNFYQTTRCNNPEDSHLHTHRRENLKSYDIIKVIRQHPVAEHNN